MKHEELEQADITQLDTPIMLSLAEQSDHRFINARFSSLLRSQGGDPGNHYTNLTTQQLRNP